jgi:hypothetical protein
MSIARPMPSTPAGSIGWLLANVAEVVDLPHDMHRAIDLQHRSVGQFLAERNGGEGWDVYPQGSVRLGTVVRPLAGGESFDLDMVCRRNIDETSTTQKALKEEVGAALVDYIESHLSVPGAPRSCEPKRRCWELCYEAEFHMDVLPAVPDRDARSATAILLTDKELVRWLPSDPIAYATWFRGRMEAEFVQLRSAMALKLSKSIEQVPEWEVKTTLQQLVQVLKAHRDLHFIDNYEDRPPSILITTLAAYAYDGGSDLFEAILHVVDHMGEYIEKSLAGPRVASPVSDENFADKWVEYPLRERKFRTWMNKVARDLEEAAGLTSIPRAATRLGEGFGMDRIIKAAGMMGIETRELQQQRKLGVVGAAAALSTSAASTTIPKHGFYGITG